MSAEGVDPGYLERDPSSPSPNQSEELLASLPPLPPPEASSAPTAVKAKDDPMYAKYFKMLSMHIPMGAVLLFSFSLKSLKPPSFARPLSASLPVFGLSVFLARISLSLSTPSYHTCAISFFSLRHCALESPSLLKVTMKMQADGLNPDILERGPDAPSPNQNVVVPEPAVPGSDFKDLQYIKSETCITTAATNLLVF